MEFPGINLTPEALKLRTQADALEGEVTRVYNMIEAVDLGRAVLVGIDRDKLVSVYRDMQAAHEVLEAKTFTPEVTMPPDRTMSLKGQQHDDHCATKELHDSKDWKPWTPSIEHNALLKMLNPLADPLYVIAKSDSVEHLYWSPKGWGPLASASRYGRDTVEATKEPKHEGFWMNLERAQELEQ